MDYLYVVIIMFITDLYSLHFLPILLKKLLFCFFVFCVFCLICFELKVIYLHSSFFITFLLLLFTYGQLVPCDFFLT